MKNLKIGLGFVGLAFAFASDAAWAGTKEKFAKETEPILAKYCYDCHGDGASKGDVQLDGLSDFQSLSKDDSPPRLIAPLKGIPGGSVSLFTPRISANFSTFSCVSREPARSTAHQSMEYDEGTSGLLFSANSP